MKYNLTILSALLILLVSFSLSDSTRVSCRLWFCGAEKYQCPQTNCTCTSNEKFCQSQNCKYPVTLFCPGYADAFTVSYSRVTKQKLRINIPCSQSLNLKRVIEDILPIARNTETQQKPEAIQICIKNTELQDLFYENILRLDSVNYHFWYNEIMFWYKGLRGLSIQITDVGLTEKFLKIFKILFPNIAHLEVVNTMFNVSVVDLSVFSTVKELTLSNNNLKQLSPTTFRNMTQLHSLRITLNKIKVISSELFSSLKSLSYLDLSNNKIKVIDSATFKNNRKLKEIHLSGNDITIIPEQLFQRLRRLQKLHLQNNSIHEFSSRTFKGQKSLWELSLHHNKLSRLSHRSFHHLTKLLVLDLSYNEIEKFHLDTFKNNKKLFSLNLESNKLTELPSNLFRNIQLNILNLKKNNVTAENFPKVAQLIY